MQEVAQLSQFDEELYKVRYRIKRFYFQVKITFPCLSILVFFYCNVLFLLPGEPYYAKGKFVGMRINKSKGRSLASL